MKDKDAAEILEVLEPVLDEVVVTRTTSPRAMSPRRLGEIADRGLRRAPGRPSSTTCPRHSTGRGRLADAGGGVSGGVLATGSVVTAAEVRMLLGTTAV